MKIRKIRLRRGIRRAATVLLLTGLASACAFAQEKPDGAALFKQHCATCHVDSANPNKQPVSTTASIVPGKAPSKDLLSQKTQEEILRALESGPMIIYGNQIVESERRAIAAYLTPKKGDAAAAAAMANLCATKSAITAGGVLSPANWNGWGHDIVNSRYQAHTSIDAGNISHLKLKWAWGVPDASTAYGQPTIVDGKLFIGSGDGRVYALNAETGCTLWTYQAETTVRTAITIGPGAHGRFLAYFADGEAMLYAVDADTGALVWKNRVDPHKLARITAAPVLYSERIYVGLAGNEELAGGDPNYPCCTFRGNVVSVNALTGRLIWKGYAITEEPHEWKPGESHAKFGPAGASIWDAATIDANRGVLYVGTGDAFVDPAADGTDAIVAFDLATGKRRWVQQKTPNDVFNFGCLDPRHLNCANRPGPDVDFGSSPILQSLGNGHRVLLAGQKTGVMYGLDPDDGGKELWQVRVGQGSGLGGIEWGSASDGKYVYAANSDISTLTRVPGAVPAPPGGLAAIDIRTGKLVWKVMPPKPACEGKPGCSAGQLAAVTVIPGVVFSGSMDGHLRAYSSGDGKVIWDFDTTPEIHTVNAVAAHGGSMSGSGPTVSGNMVFVTSGFDVTAGMPGNLLLAFELAEAGSRSH
jgi:polyvinyl alcohol dehydrogenase (cytochrome)